MPLISNTPVDNRQTLYKQERQYIDPRGRITQSDRWHNIVMHDDISIVKNDARKVFDNIDGTIYNTIGECARLANVHISTVRSHLIGEIKNHRFEYYTGDNKVVGKKAPVYKGGRPIKEVVYMVTGQIYKSTIVAARETGTAETTVQTHCRGKSTNRVFCYVDDYESLKGRFEETRELIVADFLKRKDVRAGRAQLKKELAKKAKEKAKKEARKKEIQAKKLIDKIEHIEKTECGKNAIVESVEEKEVSQFESVAILAKSKKYNKVIKC